MSLAIRRLIDCAKQVCNIGHTTRCSLGKSLAGKGNAKGPLDGVGRKLSADEIRAFYWYDSYRVNDYALGPQTPEGLAAAAVEGEERSGTNSAWMTLVLSNNARWRTDPLTRSAVVARLDAPAAVTLDVARTMDLFAMPVVRAIIKGRELVLGATSRVRPWSGGLLAEVQSLGWVVLAENPGREVVVGAVTKPWEPDVTFRSVAPEAFAEFAEAGYVKIAWTLRADPSGPNGSVFRTETRAIATDAAARDKFRRYWSFLSPGIVLIRRISLAPLKAQAERRGSQSAHSAGE